MGVIIIGPQKKDIDAIVNVRVYPFVFGAVEISKATGYTSLQGPFSLSVDVTNDSGLDIYIGISIQTREQNIVVADRKHLTFCPHQDHITLSAASVPALAYIQGEVISVTVTVYRTDTPLTGSNQTVTISLFINPYINPTSPTPYIGTDTIAYDTSEWFDGSGFNVTLLANTNGQVIAQRAPVLLYRTRVRAISMAIPPTAFPGDVRLVAFVGIGGGINIGTIARLYSKREEWAQLSMSVDIWLRTNQTFYIVGDNVNLSVNYTGDGVIAAEKVY